MWTVYEMASFGRGLGIPYPFSGASWKRFWRILWRRQPDARGMRILSCPLVYFRWLSAVPASNSFTTTDERVIDHGANEKLRFLAFDYDTVLKSIAGTDDGSHDGFW